MEKSRYFRRDGADVHTEAEISLSQAILGGTIRVQGVYEDQTIQVNCKQNVMNELATEILSDSRYHFTDYARHIIPRKSMFEWQRIETSEYARTGQSLC